MILTDADFGCVYLVESEGWARRFLVELFRSFTILFVGYSHSIFLRLLSQYLHSLSFFVKKPDILIC